MCPKDLFNNICYGHTAHAYITIHSFKAHLCVDIVTYELPLTPTFQNCPEEKFSSYKENEKKKYIAKANNEG